jgi:hypothetical protein
MFLQMASGGSSFAVTSFFLVFAVCLSVTKGEFYCNNDEHADRVSEACQICALCVLTSVVEHCIDITHADLAKDIYSSSLFYFKSLIVSPFSSKFLLLYLGTRIIQNLPVACSLPFSLTNNKKEAMLLLTYFSIQFNIM